MVDANLNGIPDNIESPASLAATRPTAFAQMSSVQPTGYLGSPNFWADAANRQDPFYLYAFAVEPTYKAQAFQNLNRSLSNSQDPNAKAAGFKNNYDYINALLVKTGLAKDALSFGSFTLLISLLSLSYLTFYWKENSYLERIGILLSVSMGFRQSNYCLYWYEYRPT